MDMLVEALSWEADDVIAVKLRTLDGEPAPTWTAGAHIDLHLPVGVRQYSLCGSAGESSAMTVGVLLAPDSRGGSRFIHEELRVGSVMEVAGPRNHFELAESEEYLFIAGGIGITPLIPMITEAEARKADWKLVYGARTRSRMAFLNLLDKFGDRVTLHPEDELGVIPLEEVLGPHSPSRLVYSCGPTAMLRALESATESWPAGSVRTERFSSDVSFDPEENDEFEVHAMKSGISVSVSPDQTIVDALEAAGIWVPTACRDGVCGSCETRVIEGVADHRDALLDHDSTESMLPCVSRSISSRITLDI